MMKKCLFFILGLTVLYCMIGSFFVMLLALWDNSNDRFYVFEKDVSAAALSGLLFIILLGIYVFVFRTLLKINEKLLSGSIFLAILLIFFTPTIINYSHSISEAIQIKSAKKKVNQNVIHIMNLIAEKKLPYEMDFDESNLYSNLHSSETTYIFLEKQSNEKISKSEVLNLVHNLPLQNTRLTIREASRDNYIAITFNENKKITFCDPEGTCKLNNIVVEENS
ncbi:hypothetical protein [Cohnella terricola]|uniref:Uncharacterized protein n=1 Tax=Cohnella terricola TaxID=1289167 RepID=A0A559JEN4_9BACL|nr:hypothetical protein [Cohnella terricola]TVX98326.1 hypothetical protein FPZ45_16670 [Cohnella terricola]